MSHILDARDDLDAAVMAALTAMRDGQVVVVPTDTVYGVAADAFNRAGTGAVFTAKRRPRAFPLPVLVHTPKQLAGLVTRVPPAAEHLMAAYWPGPLTLVVRSEPNLSWDLGDSDGTVAVRMPFDDIALAIVKAVGPLAVTSANLSGNPAATSVTLAKAQLGDAVSLYVDGGPRAETTPSTIVDLTRTTPTILRSGPLEDDEVLAVAEGRLAPHEASPFDRTAPMAATGVAAATAEPVAADDGDASDGAATSDDAASQHMAADHAAGTSGSGPKVAAADSPTDAAADTPTGSDTETPTEARRARATRHIARDHRAG